MLNLISTTIVATPPSNQLGLDDREGWNMERRRRRGFHRVISGIRMRGVGQYRLVTLTHSPFAEGAGLDIRESFRRLVMKMRRRGVLHGYVKIVEYTKAGMPHIHMVYRGSYVSQVLLSRWWESIHRSPVVDIRKVFKPERAAGYIAKYLGKDARCRYSMSLDWLWSGAAGDWRKLVGLSIAWGWLYQTLLAEWSRILDRGCGPMYFEGAWIPRLLRDGGLVEGAVSPPLPKGYSQEEIDAICRR